MRHTVSILFWMCCLVRLSCGQVTQQTPPPDTIPVATQWLLDAAGPIQRNAIRSVLELYCPQTHQKGTGFLLKSGLVITNQHVVEGCEFHEMQGINVENNKIFFSGMAVDLSRDLAALRPMLKLQGGFELSDDEDPEVGTAVDTWGYPLIYNGPSPLLSLGYVAGYSPEPVSSRQVKHIIVNGAFNPGNSGGPLLRAQDNKVVGVVVAKHNVFTPEVKLMVDSLSASNGGMLYHFKDEKGREITLNEGQVVGRALQEFYEKTQVVIGEAIAVSEVKAFLMAHQTELQPTSPSQQ